MCGGLSNQGGQIRQYKGVRNTASHGDTAMKAVPINCLEYRRTLQKNEWVFFDRVMDLQIEYDDSKFYGCPKVHKEPIGFCRVCALVHTYMGILSTWCDGKLKILYKLLHSYIKDGMDLIRRLRKKGRLHWTAHLFLPDAVAMYTNIKTSEAIYCISKWSK